MNGVKESIKEGFCLGIKIGVTAMVASWFVGKFITIKINIY